MHHNGQWINADLEDKIPVKLGERVYIQMVHDVSIWIIVSWMIFLSIESIKKVRKLVLTQRFFLKII